jgi:hypothetical protein
LQPILKSAKLLPNMKLLDDALKNNFTIVNLGCIGDTDYRLPKSLVQAITLVEIDAEGGAQTQSSYHRKIKVTTPIAGVPGKYTFVRNNFAGTCSLLRPRPGKVEEFGMQQYFHEISATEMECETLPALLKREQVATLDFLKTDVEGLDSAIIQSCKDYFGQTLAFQAELRFLPFYESEPCFHKTVALLADHGYEVLDIIHIDRWKYRTPHWKRQMEGRAVWADFLFFLKPEKLVANFGEAAPLAIAKQIILACMLGKKNYGEFLLQQFDTTLPEDWKTELRGIVKPRWPNFTQMKQLLRRQCMPLELFLKHRINRSRHVSLRQGN